MSYKFCFDILYQGKYIDDIFIDAENEEEAYNGAMEIVMQDITLRRDIDDDLDYERLHGGG